MAGTSTSCDGALLIVVDDIAPLATWAGIHGLIATLLGLIGLVAGVNTQRWKEQEGYREHAISVRAVVFDATDRAGVLRLEEIEVPKDDGGCGEHSLV